MSLSIEKQIEKTKDRYYDTLEASDAGWHDEENDSTPFIRYMLQVLLACYTELEERVGLLSDAGSRSTAYDIVRKYVEEKIGKFTGAAVISANREGLLSLANHLKSLAEKPPGTHTHLDAYNSLEDGSSELILETI